MNEIKETVNGQIICFKKINSLSDLQTVLTNQNKRSLDIAELNNEIGQLLIAFKDVEHFVDEQGNKIDFIDDKINNAQINVLHAETQLTFASKYKKQGVYLVGGILTLIGGPSAGLLYGIKAAVAASGVGLGTLIYGKIS
jgi:t-SNARE complex subunit (syntaxin)